MNDKIYTGFIAPEIIAPDHWVLGASNTPSFPVLKADGNWESLLPTEEKQNLGKFETYNCTGFNTLNAIEILMYQLTGERINYSDRWVGIIAGTKEPGNDPHKVAEAIREYGLIPEEMLPFDADLNNVDEYYSFKGADKEACYKAGREWKAKYEFKHSWVFTPGQPVIEQLNNMKVALRNSPLAIAVFAWASTDNDIYYKNGPENHWTSVYNVDDFMRIFDSYEPFKKKVEQSLQYCKRYSVTLKTEDTVKIGIMRQIVNALLKLVGLYEEQIKLVEKPVEVKPQEVYNEVKESMKYDWSTQEKARHSTRVICDEEGLSVQDKNDMCATVGGESGWKPRQRSLKPNFDGTYDHGIIQLNEKYWIGAGKLYPNIEAIYNDPEGCIRWMCKQWKAGNKHWWYAFKNGSYKKYMNPKFDSKGKLV